MDAVLEDFDAASVLVHVVLEGCCGETVAAHEAQIAADGAADPALREVLARIAADERRHAELAWQFVRWALNGNSELRTTALRAVEQALARARAVPSPAQDDAWLSEHGIVSEAQRHSLRIEALEQIALPCMRALCASHPLAA